MGGTVAPVTGSGSCPTWIARVANRQSRWLVVVILHSSPVRPQSDRISGRLPHGGECSKRAAPGQSLGLREWGDKGPIPVLAASERTNGEPYKIGEGGIRTPGTLSSTLVFESW